MTFNDILESIGGVGYFQILHTFVLLVPVCMVACHNFLQNFSAAVPGHHCQLQPNATGTNVANLNRSLEDTDLLVASIPLDGNQHPERCLRFAEVQWRLLDPNATVINMTEVGTLPCVDGWTYDQSVFSSTIITEWDLVCDLRKMRQAAQTIYMAGVLVGAVVFGGLSDRFGRRALIIWSYLQMAVAGTCVAFLPSFGSYCTFRFLCGMAFSGILLNTISLLLEWMPTKGRTATGTMMGYSFTFGQMVLSGIAYSIRDWRWLQFAVSAPFYVFFLYSWLLPESARWLILKGKPQLALRNLRRVAWLNRRPKEGSVLTVEAVKFHMQKETVAMRSSHSPVDLVRTPAMRRISCILALVWFSMSFAYYGLAMDLQKFGFSIYLVQVCFGAIDIPAKLVGAATMSKVGRRATQSCALILAGLMIIANLFVPHEMKTLRTVLAILGKGCLASAFTCAYLYSGELYPTEIRQTGMGFVSMNARAGSMVAPVILMIGDYVTVLPPLIYGSAAILSGTAAYFLMETLNCQLPDTIEAVENRMRQKPLPDETVQMALMQKEVSALPGTILNRI